MPIYRGVMDYTTKNIYVVMLVRSNLIFVD